MASRRRRSEFKSSTAAFSTTTVFLLPTIVLIISSIPCSIQAKQHHGPILPNNIIFSKEIIARRFMFTTTSSVILQSISDRDRDGRRRSSSYNQNNSFQFRAKSQSKSSDSIPKRSNTKATIMAFASSTTTPIPPPPPISMPVWSLATPIPPSTTLPSSSSPSSLMEQETSMNILTFATPISVAPPKLWAISLYKDTLTKDAFMKSQVGVLQLLHKNQTGLIGILGKRSGYEDGYSKRVECKNLMVVDDGDEKGSTMEWMRHGGDVGNNDDNDDDAFISKEDRTGALKSLHLLPGCASYIQLKLINVIEAGDHDVAICQVIKTGVWDQDRSMVVIASEPSMPKDHTTVLYTGQLREEGII